MVQNIRPPQSSYFPQRQSENLAKPLGDRDSKVEASLRTSTPASTPTKEQVEEAAALVKDVLRGTTSKLEIEVDPDLHKVVIKIRNGESGEIIRQIPAQELLDLAKYLDDPKGLLVRERA
ncbi:MAG TPA: flagellar protein FlaG [Nitrospiraceae bacterium]|nr:flagellar protein FlaG [Nitrospiraceae bacterium]